MKIRQLSDIHLESHDYIVEADESDKENVLVLAGDTCVARRKGQYGDFLEDVSKKFKYVVTISGNHEYWGGNIKRTNEKIKELIQARGLTNVFHLENESVVLDGVAFIGSTFWTNIKDPLVEIQVGQIMNDYRKIRIGTDAEPWKRRLRVSDTTILHYQARGFMQDEIKAQKEAGNKIVVVTHMAPSFKSISPKYIGDAANPAYCSDLDYWLEEGDINNWMHGHIHWHHDYMVGSCRVTCNPRGYYSKRYGGELTNYSDQFYVEV